MNRRFGAFSIRSPRSQRRGSSLVMTDERIFAYLLGELPEEEAERFDVEYFASEDLAEQIRPAEDDLIDAYLRDELTPAQRQHFEQNYLTTKARKKRVAMAAGLLGYVNTLKPEEAPAPAPVGPTWISSFIAFWGNRNWALRAGLAVGVVLIVAGGLWLSRSRTRPPRVVATLNLTISDDDRAEGAQPGRVRLPTDAEALRINLKLPGQSAAAGYDAELINDEGKTTPLSVAGRDAESVSVEIPAALLPRGEYALKLYVIRPDGTQQRVPGLYFFNVE